MFKNIEISKIGLLCLATFAMSCAPNMPVEVEVAYQSLTEEVDFNFHVKPILSDRYYSCHGPDATTRQAGLRLDIEEEAFKELESAKHAFVSRKPRSSESLLRILSDDPEVLMTPPFD